MIGRGEGFQFDSKSSGEPLEGLSREMTDMIHSPLAAEQKRHRVGQPVEIERAIRR